MATINHFFILVSNMFIRLLSCFLFIFSTAFAQLTVTNSAPYNSSNYLINGVLMSSTSGNAAQNVTVTSGLSTQLGYFDGTSSNLGMAEGVVLSTYGIGAATPQNDGNVGEGINYQDPDLQNILVNISNSGESQFNTIVYEFDFVAGGSEIEFEYIFASDEYSSYTCTEFNDVFGFFISGPGINGPYTNNAKNIALIPNPVNPLVFTNTPVMINTLNSGSPTGSGQASTCAGIDPAWTTYSTFFVNNPNEQTVAFNGFTKPLKAKSTVQCGETYHIKLAIADVGDAGVNSAVFLKKGSFEVGTPLALGIEGQTSFVKCTDHVVVDPMITGGMGNVTIEWSQNGAVFSTTPIQTFTENGSYTITVSDLCQTLTHTIVVSEYTNMALSLPDTIVLCEDTEVIPQLTGGAPLFQYTWSGAGINANSPTLHLIQGVNGTVNLNIVDDCGFEISDETFVITPEELTSSAPPQVYLCENTEITGTYTGGYGEVNYYWEFKGVIYNTSVLNVTTQDIGVAKFHVIDECGVHLIKETIITSPGPFEPIAVDILRDNFSICNRDNFRVPMHVSGGAGGVSYEWYIDGVLVSKLPNYRINGTAFTEGNHILSFKLEDVCGHVYEDEFKISKLDCFVPNVFSPGGDFVNDGFYFPIGNYQSNVILKVYDRWGKEVFYSKQYERCNENEIDECWTGLYQENGEACIDGVYFYILTFKDGDKETGTVTIFNE